ncbi:MAG: hypothetical protein ACO33A_11605 [Hyphomonas sp.]
MSSDPFRLLGLDGKTATDADVRRAYAERLKRTRPEDDRDGFMALRDAFERARQSVRWRGACDNEAEVEPEAQAEAETEKPPNCAEALIIRAAGPSAPRPEAAREAIDYNAEMAAGGRFEPQTLAPGFTEAASGQAPVPAPFDIRVGKTMDRLIDLLTAGPLGAQGKDVMAVLDHPDVAGIEEFQALQGRVRQFLCDRTGFSGNPQALRTPDWLTADVFQALDAYFGWTRQPVTLSWLRQQNDWLVRVRNQIAWDAMPEGQRRKAALAQVRAGKSRSAGGWVWLWIGAGILVIQVARALSSAGG